MVSDSKSKKELSSVSSLSLSTSTSSSLSSPAADSLSLRHKGFLKDCPDGLLTEAGFIKIYTQVTNNHQPEKIITKMRTVNVALLTKFRLINQYKLLLLFFLIWEVIVGKCNKAMVISHYLWGVLNKTNLMTKPSI